MSFSPAFGQADLTNCERELIHFAGSVQPHGVLIAVHEPQMLVLQASANTQGMLGLDAKSLLKQPVSRIEGDLAARLRRIAASGDLSEPAPLSCQLFVQGHPTTFEGTVHRVNQDVLLVEIEPTDPAPVPLETVAMDRQALLAHLGVSVQRFSAASTIGTLSDAVVRRFRDLLGYDRVMVYKFDPDGHGKIIAEARDPRLESLLGHHYPASDIPQRARELYIRNRLRVLVDVHYEPAALVPRQLPDSDQELDMSLCYLRSMSPLHLQYLKNMGVTATLVVSLVREGQLWGLIACHHYAPRNVRYSVRAGCDLLAEVISTRIAAIENYAYAQVAIQVRRLEQRLIEATSTEGDWRLALFRNPHTLLQPLDATGAALFYEGEILTSGEVPSTPELRALAHWVHGQRGDGLFSCSSVARANPALEAVTSTASGVLAVELSTSRPDYLMWFRKEQLLTVTWAGDPSKPVIGDNPLELSPRRSFAAWSEIVRGTALPWSGADTALARAFGTSLVDIILQVNAVRLLIAEHQLAQTRAAVANSLEPVVIVDAKERILFANDAFLRLVQRPQSRFATVGEIAQLFTEPGLLNSVPKMLLEERQPWRGQLTLKLNGAEVLDVTARAEVVPARDGAALGFFLILGDMKDSQRAAAARVRLEQSLSQTHTGLATSDGQARGPTESDALLGVVLTNASLAAMDIADGGATPVMAALLEEIDASTRRSGLLYDRIFQFTAAR